MWPLDNPAVEWSRRDHLCIGPGHSSHMANLGCSRTHSPVDRSLAHSRLRRIQSRQDKNPVNYYNPSGSIRVHPQPEQYRTHHRIDPYVPGTRRPDTGLAHGGPAAR